ncbi:CPBP family intramembrane glutamic endopeptidase [Pseudalkalibacillus salsuginis]|uniref:CPBP family intramembrane glutamic endopeptidase n=1 Tax=Pseudalkalibacillus salsuginis TaxID=2910972 RepID=UPI001F492063|nr:type II CAAX endopeptidase family protein [Pseudalkalibacillus salsuginis]MCF6409358.1 CPBP family intramembrane metalloprotease [Pseudalkalibacillus salsuginis]
MENKFLHIKFRYLITWYAIAIGILAFGGVFLSLMDMGGSLTSFITFSQFALYAVAVLWLRRAYYKNNMSVKGLFKSIRKSNGLGKKMLFTIFHLTFSFSVVTFIFYLFSFLVPDFLVEMLEDGDATRSFVSETSIPSFILIVLIAPIVEELVFRGTLLQKLRFKYGNTAGILVTSAIFSLIHMNSGMIGHFTLGVFLSIFYLKTKNIWVPIICHALNNFLAFFAFMIDGGSSEGSIGDAIMEIQQVGHYFGIYAFFCTIFLIWLTASQIKKLNKREEKEVVSTIQVE